MSEAVKKQKPRRGKGTFQLQPRLRVEYVDDPILYAQLMKIIQLALEIADMTPEEAERYQKQKLEEL